MEQKKEFVNDICVYLEVPVCCHPDLNAGEVSEEYCLKCKFRSIPITAKTLMLLRELYIHANTAGIIIDDLCGEGGIVASSEARELLVQLAKIINESEQFLKAVGVKLPEEVKDDEEAESAGS